MLLLTNYCRVTVPRQFRTPIATLLLLSPLPGSLANALIKPRLWPARQLSQIGFLGTDTLFTPLNRSSVARLCLALLGKLLIRHVVRFYRPQTERFTFCVGQPHMLT